MSVQRCQVEGAPKPAGPYSHAVAANGFLVLRNVGTEFVTDGLPARTTVGSTLPNILVEIDVVAAFRESASARR